MEPTAGPLSTLIETLSTTRKIWLNSQSQIVIDRQIPEGNRALDELSSTLLPPILCISPNLRSHACRVRSSGSCFYAHSSPRSLRNYFSFPRFYHLTPRPPGQSFMTSSM